MSELGHGPPFPASPEKDCFSWKKTFQAERDALILESSAAQFRRWDGEKVGLFLFVRRQRSNPGFIAVFAGRDQLVEA